MTEQTSTPIVIKRYGGTRLLRCARGPLCEPEDIADMLRAERSVAVEDAGSGKDITPKVLAQIVARQH